MRLSFSRLLSVLLAGALWVPANALEFRFAVDAGLANQDVLLDTSWEAGFSVAVTPWMVPSDNILFGVRVGYVQWSPDDDDFLAQLPVDVTEPAIEGHTRILELLPTVRIATQPALSLIGLFAQFGFGLSFRSVEVTAGGTQLGAPFSEEFFDESETDVEMNGGLGVSLGRVLGIGLEILPLYHVIRTDAGPRQYYSVNAGLSYQFGE